MEEYKMKRRDHRHDRRAKRPMRVTGRGLITILSRLEQERERKRREGVKA
jgi:hypothetical protein